MKKIKSFAVGLTALAVVAAAPAVAYAGYTPANRPTFTCNTPTDCPGADHVTFNSFTNAPNYGDERAFFDVKDAANTAAGGYADKMTVTNGQKVILRIYVHNNANPAKAADSVAKNTKLQVLLPSSKKATTVASAQISADNASPKFVSDTVDLNGAQPFTIKFDKSAPVNVTYRPNGQGATVTRALPSATFADDYTLNANMGDWKGCFEYSALITVKAVISMDTPVTPPATPTTPTSLPQTGAGSVVATVAGVSLLGAVMHRVFTSRRLSRR